MGMNAYVYGLKKENIDFETEMINAVDKNTPLRKEVSEYAKLPCDVCEEANENCSCCISDNGDEHLVVNIPSKTPEDVEVYGLEIDVKNIPDSVSKIVFKCD